MAKKTSKKGGSNARKSQKQVEDKDTKKGEKGAKGKKGKKVSVSESLLKKVKGLYDKKAKANDFEGSKQAYIFKHIRSYEKSGSKTSEKVLEKWLEKNTES